MTAAMSGTSTSRTSNVVIMAAPFERPPMSVVILAIQGRARSATHEARRRGKPKCHSVSPATAQATSAMMVNSA